MAKTEAEKRLSELTDVGLGSELINFAAVAKQS
jgi:hypothetical protein